MLMGIFSDGTATGGTQPGVDGDFVRSNGTLLFKHGETSKSIFIDINKAAKVGLFLWI